MKNKNNKFNHFLITFSTALVLSATGAHAGETTRISVSSGGKQGNGFSSPAAISADGRIVAFGSAANNLVSKDTNNAMDAFVHDRATGKTARVSVSSAEAQFNGDSSPSAISADGRFVAFNLNFGDDIFSEDFGNYCNVRDRISGTTTTIAWEPYFCQTTGISAQGRYIAFWIRGGLDGFNAYIHDLLTAKETTVSAEEFAYNETTAISSDGRYVVFNLNGDAFVRDLVTGKATRVSAGLAGVQGNGYSYGNAISADGRYVAFQSNASNLVPGDTNGKSDAFVRDIFTGKTTRVSLSSAGVQGNADSFASAISADGRYVAFQSSACNLVVGDTNAKSDAFVHDRKYGTTTRISVNSLGVQGNSNSYASAISADGRYVAFRSSADNLVAGDTNRLEDAFVHDRLLDNTHAADLQAIVIAKPASVKKGRTAHYLLKIKNNGPDRAVKLDLTNIVFNGKVTAIRPSKGQGSCSKAAVSVCNLGILAAGKSARVAVSIRANANPLTQQISVGAAPMDKAPGTNAIKISTPVRP